EIENKNINIKIISWIKRGKQRRNIIKYIKEEDTPSEIANKSGYSLNNTSRVLNEFKKIGIVRCLNPKEKTGRLYKLTKKGKLIRDKLSKT
ncbi:hypothetical protein DRJ17_04170, partial [Candidatus Woesearchaeota archaeon]